MDSNDMMFVKQMINESQHNHEPKIDERKVLKEHEVKNTYSPYIFCPDCGKIPNPAFKGAKKCLGCDAVNPKGTPKCLFCNEDDEEFEDLDFTGEPKGFLGLW